MHYFMAGKDVIRINPFIICLVYCRFSLPTDLIFTAAIEASLVGNLVLVHFEYRMYIVMHSLCYILQTCGKIFHLDGGEWLCIV